MLNESIVETLQQQLELYELLLETAKQKTPVLVCNDVEQLNGLTLKERKLLNRAEELEVQRTTQANIHFSKLGYRTRNGKLSDMIRTTTQPHEKLKLMELQQQLSAKLEELKKVNDLNQQLIAQSLRFIEYSIDLLMETPYDDLVYQHPVNKGNGLRPSGLFNTRV
ncbi:flagellar protein FlgN [Paenibacillus sp. sptzw28]|uniref:flagellar protein FlgN n=1 Tax=Paenibacillus sp. sptzw28 TaxID=715179 RepID=UPI001C6ED49B|nr:flagellar protein FlgN [Paenibacillus sp. sptzw28]QYR22107.1 flagellar protein FlgN [Paenibacillus sp. sptzw28]